MFSLWIKDGQEERPMGNFETIEAAENYISDIKNLISAELSDCENGDVYVWNGWGFYITDM